jgi:hypothetical protein
VRSFGREDSTVGSDGLAGKAPDRRVRLGDAAAVWGPTPGASVFHEYSGNLVEFAKPFFSYRTGRGRNVVE